MVYLRKRSLDGEFYFYPRMRRIPSLNAIIFVPWPLYYRNQGIFGFDPNSFSSPEKEEEKKVLALFQAHKKLLVYLCCCA